MRWFAAGPTIPGPVRRAVPDKVLASAGAEDGTWLLGARDAIHAVGGEGQVRFSLRWEEVQRADWVNDTTTLRLERIEDYGRPVTSYSFVLREPGDLLALVRERVTASVLLQRRVDLGRKRGFSVIARRAPGGTGAATWAYEFDEGVDPEDPAVVAAADAALREARESLGL